MWQLKTKTIPVVVREGELLRNKVEYLDSISYAKKIAFFSIAYILRKCLFF